MAMMHLDDNQSLEKNQIRLDNLNHYDNIIPINWRVHDEIMEIKKQIRE